MPSLRNWIQFDRHHVGSVSRLAKQAGYGLQAQNAVAEIKLRAERKAGELIPTIITKGGDPKLHDATLAKLGLDKFQSFRWQLEANPNLSR